ncbi:MAG: histidine kinase [Reichenbachiella sp.]
MKNLKEIHVRWIGIPLVSVIMTFLIKDPSHDHMTWLTEYFISIIFTGILWSGIVMIIKAYRRKYPDVNDTIKRLIYTSFFSSVFLIIGSNIIGLSLGLCSVVTLSDWAFFFRHAHINLITSFMVASIYEIVYFFTKWKDSEIQNEKLKVQQMKTQYGVLQNQVSPHFLFNSLNTLTTLISENQNTAIDFTQMLSEVYRYILQNKEKEIVTVKDELAFSESYVFLMKKRYPENLHINFNITNEQKRLYIAPFTIQILIENAVKHNIVSKSVPLKIDVNVDKQNRIVVSNLLNVKKTLEVSTKTGLNNLIKRYELLGGRMVNVLDDQGKFEVSIPLIELLSEVEYLKTTDE